MISIEVVRNGRAVTDRYGMKHAFDDQIKYLTHVYQLTCSYQAGDQVVIKKKVVE